MNLLENFNLRMAQRLQNSIVEDGPMLNISATEIREKARLGESMDKLVPESVANYILEEGLYK